MLAKSNHDVRMLNCLLQSVCSTESDSSSSESDSDDDSKASSPVSAKV